MNYYISDLHLFHKNVTSEGKNFDDRPFATIEEMHTVIKNKWNNKVTNEDTVYILGDVSMRGKNEDLIAYVSMLKGHKILIKGNHDDISDNSYRCLYDDICDYKEITDRLGSETKHLVLSHYPILMWKNQHRGWIHLYGHVHQSIEEFYYQKCLRGMNEEEFMLSRPNDSKIEAYNVGCMMPWIDYEPRSLEEILAFNRKG